MSSSLSSSCHHNGQQEKGHTFNGNKKRQEQQQQNFTKNEKSYGNTGRQTHKTAAASTSNLKFESISQHFNDNDEIIAALLNAFQLQTHFNNVNTENTNNANQQSIQKNSVSPNINMDNGSYAQQHTAYHNQEKLNTESSSAFCCANSKNLLFISPKLLLNKLRLCHYNKYWLVQNKYAEVISNLNYASLRSYYGNKYTNNLNAQNHNGCCICKSNCCCSSSFSSSCSSFHSCSCYCCCCCCGTAMDYEDDIDHMDFVCNLEVRILDYLFVTYLSYVVFFF